MNIWFKTDHCVLLYIENIPENNKNSPPVTTSQDSSVVRNVVRGGLHYPCPVGGVDKFCHDEECGEALREQHPVKTRNGRRQELKVSFLEHLSATKHYLASTILFEQEVD